MRITAIRFLAMLLIASVVTPVLAQEYQTPVTQAIMIDGETGAVLFEKDSSARFEPASLTKLMTAEVVFHLLETGKLTPTQTFKVSTFAWKTGGAPSRTSTMFAAVNKEVSVLDLLRGMIIANGNDAAITLAEGVAGNETEFAKLMNSRAAELGLVNSHFVNATGLPQEGQYTTAKDIAKLSQHLSANYPQLFQLYKEPEITWNKITQRNKNPFLTLYKGSDGLVNAYSEKSGFSTAITVNRNNRQLFLVMNGTKSDKERTAEAIRLFDWGFSSFSRKLVFDKNQTVGYARVFGGEKSKVSLIVKEPVGIMLYQQKNTMIRAKIVYQGPLNAPVKEGVAVGTLRIYFDKSLLIESPVFTAENVEETGLTGKTKDALYELTVGRLRHYFR